MYKSPNATMSNNKDWASIDLESLNPSALPTTVYKPVGDPAAYDAAFPRWGAPPESARSSYRVFWRMMAANTGERTLIPAIVPPGYAHVRQSLLSIGLQPNAPTDLLVIAGVMSSLVADLTVRAAPKSSILFGSIRRLPMVTPRLVPELALRALRLNAVTSEYAELWSRSILETSSNVDWTGGMSYIGRDPLTEVSASWSPRAPLRRASDRRQAQVEIDAIVALSLGITADELCTIYRTQFAVLYGYDRNTYLYDVNGRLVPNEVLKVWRQKGEAISKEERTATNASGNTYEYELPFVTLDREADMRQAYAHFEKILQERS